MTVNGSYEGILHSQNVSFISANTWSADGARISSDQAFNIASNEMDRAHCDEGALTDRFGWFIQGVLATLAFMLLIIKRFIEPKIYRRPWVVWFYDTSKQGIGGLVIHFANVFLAGVFTGDPCTWYIVSFLLDSSVGLFFIFIGIRASQWLAKRKGWSAFNFGEYGVPPRWQAWLGQSGVYILIMVIEKVLITLIIQLDFWNDVRDIILSPIQDPRLELAIVVLVIPFVINALMFWVVDNFLMRKHTKSKNDYMNPVARRKIQYKKDDRLANSEAEILLSGEDENNSCELLMEVNNSTHRHNATTSALTTETSAPNNSDAPMAETATLLQLIQSIINKTKP
ncbi:hypothetical protein CHUAL_013396 [Chamberlinius hualienensis]